MRLRTQNIQKLLSMTLIYGAIGMLFISGAQVAMANPGIGTIVSPTTPQVDGNVKVGPGVPGGAIESYQDVLIRLYTPMTNLESTSITPDITGAACVMQGNPAAGGKTWELWISDADGNGNPGPAQIDVGLNSFVTAKFGNQGNAEMDFGVGGAVSSEEPQLGNLFWRQIEGAGSPTNSNDAITLLVQVGDNPLTKYRIAVCGLALDGGGSSLGLTEQTDSFFTQIAVGGEIIPINAISLLTAGALGNSIMTLPIIGAAAGIAGFAYTKLRSKK